MKTKVGELILVAVMIKYVMPVTGCFWGALLFITIMAFLAPSQREINYKPFFRFLGESMEKGATLSETADEKVSPDRQS